jgi:AcrR family transcriptional regulator
MKSSKSQALRPAVTPPKPTQGRRERRRIETRASIMRAALELIERQGFSDTSIEQITASADIGKGTFFNYFPSKDHLLAGFAEKQISKIESALDTARSGHRPLRDILARLLAALQEEPSRNPELARGLLVALLSSQPVRDVANPHLQHGRQLMAELLALGQKRGELRTDRKSLDMAAFFQLTALGTLLLWSLDPRINLEEGRRSVFELVWSAVASAPSRKPEEQVR